MTTVWSLFEQRAASGPDDLVAIDEEGTRLTFAQARRSALDVAARLESEHGVRCGDVVSWQLPNWIDSVLLCLALCRLEAVQNPLVAILAEREVGFICSEANSKLVIVPRGYGSFDHAAMAAAIAGRRPSMSVMVIERGALLSSAAGAQEIAVGRADGAGDAVRWIFYTSGTTADPKGARHTDSTVIAAAEGFVAALGLTADDRLTTLLPLTHVGGVVHLIATLLTGAPMILAPAFVPDRTIPFLRDERATVIPGAMPFVHAYFAYQEAHPDVAPLFPAARMMTHGGAPKPPALHFEAKERVGTVGIVSGYGMTECPMSIWNRPGDPDEDLAHTEGYPVPGVDLRIVGPDDREVAPCEEGEVRVRGPQLMLGYVNAALDTEAFDREGFFRSGDLGVVDARGRLRITGRLKDIIIRNMENISGTELDNLLHQHPKVLEVAVIGVPDAVTGERACAVVVPRDPADPPELAELCEHLLAHGLSTRKLPERLELVDALPRNAMHKVLKNELRSRYGTV